MPGNTRSKPTNVQIPYKGVDEGSPDFAQAELTCPDSLNVVGFDLRDKTGLGKRSGLKKAFSTQVGIGTLTNGLRVNHLSGFPEPGSVPSAAGGSAVSVADDYSGMSESYPGPASSNIAFGTFGRTGHATTYQNGIYEGSPYTDYGGHAHPSAPASRFAFNFSSVLAITDAFIGRVGFLLFPLRWIGGDTVSATFCGLDNQQAVAGAPIRAQLQHVGLFMRSDGIFTRGVYAHLRWTSATTVQLQLGEWIGSSSSVGLAASSDLTLPNLGNWIDDVIMTLVDNGTKVTATVTSATLSWNASIEYSSFSVAHDSEKARCGFGAFHAPPVGFVSTFNVTGSNKFRYVKNFSATAFKPAALSVQHSMLGTDSNGGSQFYVPSGLSSIYGQGSGLSTNYSKIDGEANSAARSSTFADIVVIDQINANLISSSNNTTTPKHHVVIPTSEPTSRLTCNFRLLTLFNANERFPGFCTRVSEDGKTAVVLKFSAFTATTSTEKTVKKFGVITGNGGWDINAYYFHNGTVIASESAFTYVSGLNILAIFVNTEDTCTWLDTGTVVKLLVNGVVMFSYTLNTTNLTTMGATDFKRTGFSGNTNSATTLYHGFTLGSAPDLSTVNVGDGSFTVAAFTRERVYVGNSVTGTMNPAVGQGLDKPLVSTAILFKKLYAVDGERSKVIDPATLTVSNWVATAPATLPPGCRLACTYRGRIVLARDASSAQNWYMSRLGDALDWDFGASPESTTAVAGNSSGKFGQPADSITALIPYSDDLLIFGCSKSMWVMEGDPGAGGRVQNVSYKTGVIGPRSWCFDDQGHLYFMGSGGLYRMPRGTRDAVPVSGRRLTRLLDRVDTSKTFVQMGFDSFKQWVIICLTSTDSSVVGVHVIYDTISDALWPTTFATYDHNPWSILEVVGVEDEQRRVLFGGSGGYIRRMDDASASDDGTVIDSYVRLAEMEVGSGTIESVVAEMQAEFSKDLPATLNWYLVSGRSANEIVNIPTADIFSGAADSLTGQFSTSLGFQTPVRMRRRGGAHSLVLRNNTATEQWAVERIRLYPAVAGRRR